MTDKKPISEILDNAEERLSQRMKSVADECTAHKLRHDVLDRIEQSGLKEFNGDGLAWGQWCRDMAIAANYGDAAWVERLTKLPVAELDEDEEAYYREGQDKGYNPLAGS